MRLRHRKNLPGRLNAVSELLALNPADLAGRWKQSPDFAASALRVELGCGLGSHTCALAAQNPRDIVVGVEKNADALIVAAERAKKTGAANARFVSCDAAGMALWFERGEIDELIINFCDPWPHRKHSARRLVARGFLELYAPLLSQGGRLRFKTDNTELFSFAKKELSCSGWDILDETDDLPDGGGNIVTDYEVRFRAEGVPISYLCAAPSGHLMKKLAAQAAPTPAAPASA